eukprot:tig00020604_g11865.t1
MLVAALVIGALSFVIFVFPWLLSNAAKVFYEPTGYNTVLVHECPSLNGKRKYWPTPWLWSGHLQTLRVVWMTTEPVIDYIRQLVPMDDGGSIAVDWSSYGFRRDERGAVTSAPGYERTPLFLVLHGLTGGSHEQYVRNFIAEAHQNGWRAVVMNARGCGGSQLVTSQWFCAAWTADVRKIAVDVQRVVPDAPVIGIGFSLGSNILVKYLGEEGEATPLAAGISVGNPWDLPESSRQLSAFMSRVTYSRVMAQSLIKHFLENAHYYDEWDGICRDRIIRSRTVREFDDTFTRVLFGYESVDAYYRDASSAYYLKGVRVPLLAISDIDDPICSSSAVPYADCRANENLILATTRRGGHLGWFEGWASSSSWVNGAAAEFTAALLRLRLEHGMTRSEKHPAVVPPPPPTARLGASGSPSGSPAPCPACSDEGAGCGGGPGGPGAKRPSLSSHRGD